MHPPLHSARQTALHEISFERVQNMGDYFLRRFSQNQVSAVSKLALHRPIFAAKLQRNSNVSAQLRTLHKRLGISARYGIERDMAACAEAAWLVLVGPDAYDRELWLRADAALAWHRMRAAARQNGINLLPISGFRSIEYQARIIHNKLRKGQNIAQILRVSAAPGYSEHHSGRALDLAESLDDVLNESFEHSNAFAWLQDRASRFGFHMSFPRDNPHQVAFEPWHWCFSAR
jgi:zinc D-Ala-D-Ala carboxypeptidase